jgi:hypothetical protein
MPAIDYISYYSPCQAKKHTHASPKELMNEIVKIAMAIVEVQ